MNLKLFRYHGAKYRFEKKYKKHSGENINPLEVHRNMRGCILEVNSEGLVVVDSILVYHFVNPDLRVETFHANV